MLNRELLKNKFKLAYAKFVIIINRFKLAYAKSVIIKTTNLD